MHYLCRRCCAVGAGSSGRNAICDASRSTVIITPHHSTRARKANAKDKAPIAISARRYDAILPDSRTRPRRTRSPVQSMMDLLIDDQSNPSRCRKYWLASLFQTPRVDSPVLLTVPRLLQIEGSLEGVSSITHYFFCSILHASL